MPDEPLATSVHDTMQRLQQMARQVAHKDPQVLTGSATYLADFAAYECWQPYLSLLEWCLQKKKPPLLSHHINIVRIQYLYLGDTEAAAQSCRRLVTEQRLAFAPFCHHVLPSLIEEGDYKGEAHFLRAIAGSFAQSSDQIACMERLTLLYDKKLPSDDLMHEFYERILSLDSHNLKALRYFKTLHSQNGSWLDVAELLQRMLAVASHAAEVFRLAQELASVYLYQLDKPAKAIAVLEKHCQHSPLDASNLIFDAYVRLRDWQGGLRVLKQLLQRLSDPRQEALVHYRIGQLFSQQGRNDEAAKHCQLAVQLYPQLLEPHEELVYLALQEKDWTAVKKLLEQLKSKLEGDKEKQLISALVTQIEAALEPPGRNPAGP